MRRPVRILRNLAAAAALLIAGVVAVLATPQPLFAHHLAYRNFEIWSDRPIAPQITGVLDDAQRRMRTSALYAPDARYRVFFCNDEWRLALYGHRQPAHLAGYADSFLTGNVYLRRADIAADHLVPHNGWSPLMADRPLAYYVAHELTHIMEGRSFSRALALYPRWVREGYADYVGKAGAFDLRENAELLRAGDPRLSHARSGLYREYHLEVAYLLDRKGWTVQRLFRAPPDEAAVKQMILADPTL